MPDRTPRAGAAAVIAAVVLALLTGAYQCAQTVRLGKIAAFYKLVNDVGGDLGPIHRYWLGLAFQPLLSPIAALPLVMGGGRALLRVPAGRWLI